MILGFKRNFPWGEPTEFKEQIQAGIKIHSMRADTVNRWHAGRAITMVYRGKNYRIEEYIKVCVCISTQQVVIKYAKPNLLPDVYVDGRLLELDEVHTLAINDGFKDGINDFFNWFNKDWQGKLIHWTDLKY
jgi:hypothetical protein